MIKKNILFLPSNKNHVLIFLPIYRILKKKYNIVFLTQDAYKNENAEKTLSNLNIDFIPFDSNKHKPDLFLQNFNIGAMVVGNDSDIIPQWFVNTCNLTNIPSVLIQDGLMFAIRTTNKKNKNLFNSFFKSNKKLLKLKFKLGNKISNISYGESNCTQIHIWGKASLPFFTQKKIPINKFATIGYPKQISEKNYNSNSKTILYTPTALTKLGYINKKEKKFILKSLVESIKDIPNVKLIIKPHPIENKKLYEEFLKNSSIKIDFSNENFSSLISMADLVISDLSTTSLESVFLGIPVIIFLPNLNELTYSDQFPDDLIKKNIFLYADKPNILSNQIKRVLTNSYSFPDDYQIYLENYFGNKNNNSAKISAEYIEKLME